MVSPESQAVKTQFYRYYYRCRSCDAYKGPMLNLEAFEEAAQKHADDCPGHRVRRWIRYEAHIDLGDVFTPTPIEILTGG